MVTREEWLRQAVILIDTYVFSGELELLGRDFQISCGMCRGRKNIDIYQPPTGEDVSINDFFPTTIIVNHSFDDPVRLIGELALECIHAFMDVEGKGKRFKNLADKYCFVYPYKGYCPSDLLMDKINQIYSSLKKTHGEWPGKPVIIKPKEKGEKKKNSYTVFCPNCDYEMKITKKMLEKHRGGLPTCPCGAKMGLDLEDESLEGAEDKN